MKDLNSDAGVLMIKGLGKMLGRYVGTVGKKPVRRKVGPQSQAGCILLLQIRMAALAVLDRERDGQVADPAELPVDDIVHAEHIGSLFLNVEDVGMTVRAIQPLGMLLMREGRPGPDHPPLGLQAEFLLVGNGLIVLVPETLLRGDQFPSEGLDPVDLVAVQRFRQVLQFAEPGIAGTDIAGMADRARLFVDAEGPDVIVTGAAIFALPDLCIRDVRRVRLHGEVELEVADTAGIITPVDPMGKGHRRMGAADGHPADQHIAVASGRRKRGERENVIEPSPFPRCVRFVHAGNGADGQEQGETQCSLHRHSVAHALLLPTG